MTEVTESADYTASSCLSRFLNRRKVRVDTASLPDGSLVFRVGIKCNVRRKLCRQPEQRNCGIVSTLCSHKFPEMQTGFDGVVGGEGVVGEEIVLRVNKKEKDEMLLLLLLYLLPS